MKRKAGRKRRPKATWVAPSFAFFVIVVGTDENITFTAFQMQAEPTWEMGKSTTYSNRRKNLAFKRPNRARFKKRPGPKALNRVLQGFDDDDDNNEAKCSRRTPTDEKYASSGKSLRNFDCFFVRKQFLFSTPCEAKRCRMEGTQKPKPPSVRDMAITTSSTD